MCTSFYISLQDNPERIVTTEKVFWLSGLYSVCPLVIMVISYSLICYKIKLSNNTLLCQQTKTFNKHKSEVRIILYPNETFFKHCESSKQFGVDDKCVELWLHKHVLYNLRNHFLFFRSDLHEWLELYLATTSFLPSFPPSYYYSGKASYSRIKIYWENYVFLITALHSPKCWKHQIPAKKRSRNWEKR